MDAMRSHCSLKRVKSDSILSLDLESLGRLVREAAAILLETETGFTKQRRAIGHGGEAMQGNRRIYFVFPPFDSKGGGAAA